MTWALAVSVIASVVVLMRWTANRLRFRHIPGPFAPPIIGNLFQLKQYGLHEYTEMCRKKYGRLFKIYLGSRMFIISAEPGVSRKILYKLLNHNMGPQLSADTSSHDISQKGLFVARDEHWRALRMAWQPAFSSTSLEGYSTLMDGCAVKLCNLLEPVAEEGTVIDMWREIGKMTMSVVGTCAYGINFHTMDEAPQGEVEGSKLVQASQRVFEFAGMLSGSGWARQLLFFPDAAWMVQWLAARLPDQRLKDLTQARNTIVSVSRNLVNQWRTTRSHPCAPSTPAPYKISAVSPRASPVPSPGDTGVTPDQKVPVSKPALAAGIAPGSFLGLLMDNNKRGTFDDDIVIAQSNTFILAGYETTANSISMTLHAISAHPRVQERVLSEIDCFGRDREVTYADLTGDNFPYLQATIKEALRLFPAAAMTHREVSKDAGFELLPGLKMNKGEMLYVSNYCMQRDEEYWPKALEFLPERFMPEGSALAPSLPLELVFTPFGGGPRLCIGYRFAQQEVLITLIRLLQRFTFELEPGMVPLRLVHRLTLSPRDGVRCRVVRRA